MSIRRKAIGCVGERVVVLVRVVGRMRVTVVRRSRWAIHGREGRCTGGRRCRRGRVGRVHGGWHSDCAEPFRAGEGRQVETLSSVGERTLLVLVLQLLLKAPIRTSFECLVRMLTETR